MVIVDEFGREVQGVRSTTPNQKEWGGGERSPSPRRYNDHRSPSRHHREERYYDDTKRKRKRSRSPSPPRRGGRYQNRRSPSPEEQHRHHRRRKFKYPVEQYIDEPMLCEFLWKRKMEAETVDVDEHKEEDGEKKEDAVEEEKEKETYESYRKRYCLDYIRSFFNSHLDDEWFRNHYSPKLQNEIMLKNQTRAQNEASEIKQQFEENQEDFLQKVRLGIGKKHDEHSEGQHDMISEGESVPSSHFISGYENASVRVSDVPSFVSHSQLKMALAEYTANNSILRMSSTSISCGNTNYCNSLDRSTWIIFNDDAAKNTFIENLSKANGTHSSDRRTNDSIKRSSHQRSILELEIDCSDPFGRTDFDDDGHGAAPSSLPHQEESSKQDTSRPANAPKVPQRKCTVCVHTTSPRYNMSVLSAAISSTSRFSKDKNSALMICRALDTTLSIPSGSRLDDLITLLDENVTEEDVLDIAIAYLRRVHLFSFYTGKGPAECEGDVLDGKHSSGTIFLRMKDADEFLKQRSKPTDNEENEESTSDLLVKHLDESITQAIEDTTNKINANLLNEETLEQAEEITSLEEQTKESWLLDHSLLDADGRARCSFHFCRKLFKDQTFLHKHLLKKHPDHLNAEQAKCHDGFMMKNWEGDACRPVPQIIIDCGVRFGLQPAVVTGADPIAYDPEPEMLKKDEEIKSKREEERLRRAAAAAANREYFEDDKNDQKFGFVDVDDMKDEKVELVFDVVLPKDGEGVKKKKRKKKKLL